MGSPAGYRSRFDDWDRRSWVRAKPRRQSAFAAELEYFSPELFLPLRHPSVVAAPAEVRRALLVHALYEYLEFTVRLETGPVNEVCLLLRSSGFLPWLPAQMLDDALRIYTDEAGHAEMSQSLLSDVQRETGIRPLGTQPRFLGELERLCEAEHVTLRPLVRLFFVIVSETLITGTLTKLPTDRRVQRVVREVAADHAADEGRHHSYFRQLFGYVWPRLAEEQRARLGPLLPEMILSFLGPDEASLAATLAAVGYFPDPQRLAAEVVALPAARQRVLDGAHPTLRMLRAGGVFADPAIATAFQARGFGPALCLPGLAER
jgi:hypothetical protein